MRGFFHQILLFLDPETAHHIAVSFLKTLAPRKKESFTPLILTRLPKIKFKNRVGLAAGFDKNAEVFPGLSTLGFGFVEVGTVTPLAQKGNPPPRLWRTENETLVNQMGFNNCGLMRFKENFKKGKERVSIPVFANIGKNKDTPNEKAWDDYEKGFLALKEDVDGFVVNVSSPNTPGLRNLQSEDFLQRIESLMPKDLPVFVKFSADLKQEELLPLLGFIKQSQFAGVVLVNTSSVLAEKIAKKNVGGLSGRALFEKALEKVALAKESLREEKTIIGVGGISSKEDYLKIRKAGADLVELYTAFIYQGPQLIRTLSELE